MPIYEYKCEDCDCCFEKLMFAGDDEVVCCPQCGQDRVKKQVSCVSFFGSSSGGLCRTESTGFS